MALPEDPMGRGDSGLEGIFADLSPRGIPPKEIRQHWEPLLDHWRRLCTVLDRDPGLRVALVDFFHNLRPRLRNPVFMEGEWFERWSASGRNRPASGILSRGDFGDAVRMEVNRAIRYGHEFSILKLGPAEPIRDPAGVRSAREAPFPPAEVLTNAVRGSDVRGRSGNGGILLLLPETGRMGAHALGERFLRVCTGPPSGTAPGIEYRSRGVRGGVAAFPEDGTTAVELISRAEEAFSRAGGTGESGMGGFSRERRNGIRRNLSGVVLRVRAPGAGDAPELPAEPRDFSPGGVFLETSMPFGIGQEIWLLPPRGAGVPDTGAIRARVVRKSETQKRRFPFGLAVEIPVPGDRRRIAGWLRRAADGQETGKPG